MITIDKNVRDQIATGNPTAAADAIARIARREVAGAGFAVIRGFDPARGENAIHAVTNHIPAEFGKLYADPDNGLEFIQAKAGAAVAGLCSRDDNTAEVPLHTDFAYMEKPNRWTFIFTGDAGPGGGKLLLCRAEYMESRTDMFDMDAVFAAGVEHALVLPVLDNDDDGKPYVRFNATIMAADGADPGKFAAASRSCRSMLATLRGYSIEIDREAGDLIVIDNRRMLHGRTACHVEISGDGTIDSLEEIHAFVL